MECSDLALAQELEEPFFGEDNDVNLSDLHVDFNEKLLTLINVNTWRSNWPARGPGRRSGLHLVLQSENT